MGISVPVFMYPVEAAKETTSKGKANLFVYVYVNFYAWDFSSVEFTVFCKVNICFLSKALSHLRQKIPIWTLMNFIRCAIRLSSSSGIECLPEKQKEVAVDQTY